MGHFKLIAINLAIHTVICLLVALCLSLYIETRIKGMFGFFFVSIFSTLWLSFAFIIFRKGKRKASNQNS